MLLRGSILATVVTLAAFCGSHDAKAQGVFTLSSPGFKDGERLATKFAGNNKTNPNCVGENVSPAFSWANPPEGTKSYALMMFDPEGRPPGGVSHWVAYGIPVSVTGFAEGEVSKPGDKYIGGTSTMKLSNYFGPCTPPGPLHHYTIEVYALDVPIDVAVSTASTPVAAALESRANVMKAMQGHVLGKAVYVGLFHRPK